ncbi:MAG: helix-turn-helix domain-containing protein [Candidatus Paceibacterota bacterium]
MNVTATERRTVLKLFNVSEAARQVGVSVRKLHWEITAGRLPAPEIQLGKRRYFSKDSLNALTEQWAKDNRP